MITIGMIIMITMATMTAIMIELPPSLTMMMTIIIGMPSMLAPPTTAAAAVLILPLPAS